MIHRIALCLWAIAVTSGGSGCMLWTSHAQGQAMQKQIDELKAQIAENTEVARRLSQDFDERIRRLDQALDRATLVLERNSADLGLQFEKLQNHVAQIEGRVEETAHNGDALGRRFDDFRASSDVKLEQLSNQVKTDLGPPIPDTADALYAEAQKQMEGKRWRDARRLLEAFINRYPKNPRAPGASVLDGDAYKEDGRLANAIGVWTKLIDTHPPEEVESEAMYKSALGFAALKYCSDARVYLRALIKRHPDSKWKKDAAELLKNMEKHRNDKTECTA